MSCAHAYDVHCLLCTIGFDAVVHWLPPPRFGQEYKVQVTYPDGSSGVLRYSRKYGWEFEE